MFSVINLKTDFLKINTLDLYENEIAFIRGKSGAGKSLFLRAIADIDVNSGDVFLGEDRREKIPGNLWRKKVMLLPAQPKWWGEEVGDSLQCKETLLVALELPINILEQKVETISTGESKRLALLRVLEKKPRVLLLDEPTANLDASTKKNMEDYIVSYLTKFSASAIWVSHDNLQIARVSKNINTKIYTMEAGHLHGDHL